MNAKLRAGKAIVKKLLPKAARKLSPAKIKKRIVAGTVAAATAVSLLTASAASNPAELLNDDKNTLNPPIAIVETYVPDTPPDDDSGDAADEQEEKKRTGLREKLRALLLRLPLSVRALVCVPMWCVGWAISSGAGVLGSAIAGSVGSSVLRVLFSALAVFALIVLNIKTVAPNVPVKKLLSKKTALIALVAAITAEICFVLLEIILPEGQRMVELIKSLAALCVMLAAALPFTVKQIKKHTSD